MVPDADLQLKVVLKALREIVMPGIDPANGVALEQLHLSIITIDLVRSRLPLHHQRARRELRNAVDLAVAVANVGCAPETSTPVADAEAALNDATATGATLDALRLRILAAVEAIVAASNGSLKIARAVIAATRPQTELARAWCAPAGFEVDPHDVPGLDAVLAD